MVFFRRPVTGPVFASLLVLSVGCGLGGCARTVTAGPGAGGSPTPGIAGGKPGAAADMAVSPTTTSPSQPQIDSVTPGQTVTPVGSGPGGAGTQYP